MTIPAIVGYHDPLEACWKLWAADLDWPAPPVPTMILPRHFKAPPGAVRVASPYSDETIAAIRRIRRVR